MEGGFYLLFVRPATISVTLLCNTIGRAGAMFATTPLIEARGFAGCACYALEWSQPAGPKPSLYKPSRAKGGLMIVFVGSRTRKLDRILEGLRAVSDHVILGTTARIRWQTSSKQDEKREDKSQKL